ncbi:hypothetical protein AMIS_25540 [Actinoplanes missouriensis 431]|uniref:Uncharacterized protein n=1 Tax=Actinoplanes missouriensis (strain ATCC 14538 / DSM 43046 / CBS 188.64 / JCM 3121 / NBRC 102363 / NCIMB 12654 / NRRL B-3342 / UNCC 431) TaxID=512565 RepID=I0H437_ACTM4|nr:radical SAM protein [Actinoplanes missouriensis]BAL87774.1 hypothetical protein AMIS_25540 [Actinoplanes missouriensis 431]
MTKVLLVKPPVRAFMVKIGRHLPIGLMYLAAALKKEGHEVSLFDSLAYLDDNHVVADEDLTVADRVKLDAHPYWKHLVHWGASWERIAAAIAAAQPDVVGVSCMFTPYYEPAYQTCGMARRLVPDATVVLGGQHPTAMPEHCLTHSAADLVVLGEAERTFPRLLLALAGGEQPAGLDGVGFRCGDGYCDCPAGEHRRHITPNRSWIQDLDGLPWPAFDQVDFADYAGNGTLITSRGCPFSCSFCTVHATVGKAFRARSVQSVVEEIRHAVAAYGVRGFHIEDDNFTFDMDRVLSLCHALIAEKMDVELFLPNGITVIGMTREIAAVMAEAGFKRLFFGLETTSGFRLRQIKKGFTSADKVQAGASWFRSEGVTASASLIVGLPGQEMAEMAYDSATMLERGVPFMTNPFYPIPGSQDFRICREKGLLTDDTEPALFDMFNFSLGSDLLNAQELYWAWIATQAMSVWPDFVRAGHEARRAGHTLDTMRSMRDLVRHSREIPHDTQLKQAVSPVSVDGTIIETDRDGCFCSSQVLRERDIGGGPRDACAFTRDVLAWGVSLHTGRPHAGIQVSASVFGQEDPCRFEITETSCDMRTRVLRTFDDALAEALG